MLRIFFSGASESPQSPTRSPDMSQAPRQQGHGLRTVTPRSAHAPRHTAALTALDPCNLAHDMFPQSVDQPAAQTENPGRYQAKSMATERSVSVVKHRTSIDTQKPLRQHANERADHSSPPDN